MPSPVLTAYGHIPIYESAWKSARSKRVRALLTARMQKAGKMQRIANFIAACLVVLVLIAPGHAQDSPSLGDLARQAQKNKTNAPAKKVLTNDDISSGSSSGAGFASSGLGSIASPAAAHGTPSAPGATPPPEQAAGQLEAFINKIAALSRAELVKGALQGVDTDFPGRGEWEQKLLSARQEYVAYGRELLQKAQQIQASTESLKGIQDPNDRRLKDLNNRMKSLIQDGTTLDAAFQAVILEGRDMASQVQGH